MHRLARRGRRLAARAESRLDTEICPPRRPRPLVPARASLEPPTELDVERHRHRRARHRLPPAAAVATPADAPARTAASSNTAVARPRPGCIVVGQRFQHRRDASFIDGARHDAEAVVGHLLAQAGGLAAPCVACEEPAA